VVDDAASPLKLVELVELDSPSIVEDFLLAIDTWDGEAVTLYLYDHDWLALGDAVANPAALTAWSRP
jgi:hypothetical protein